MSLIRVNTKHSRSASLSVARMHTHANVRCFCISFHQPEMWNLSSTFIFLSESSSFQLHSLTLSKLSSSRVFLLMPVFRFISAAPSLCSVFVFSLPLRLFQEGEQVVAGKSLSYTPSSDERESERHIWITPEHCWAGKNCTFEREEAGDRVCVWTSVMRPTELKQRKIKTCVMVPVLWMHMANLQSLICDRTRWTRTNPSCAQTLSNARAWSLLWTPSVSCSWLLQCGAQPGVGFVLSACSDWIYQISLVYDF